MRWLGLALLAGLLAFNVGLRERAVARSARLLAGEELGRQRMQALAATLAGAADGTQPAAVRLARLTDQVGLQSLPSSGDATSAFAQDAAYMYGLGLTTETDRDGETRSGWVLRSWPREYGVTGDLEFHLDSTGALREGQNSVGRSGVEEGFPPSFRLRGDSLSGKLWWPSPRAPTRAPQAASQR